MQRRDFLGAAAAMPLLGMASGAAAGRRGFDANDPADRFRAYMLMRGALDERLVIGYVAGSYYGVVGAEVTPLWDVVGVTFTRYRRRADGGYDGYTGEIAHFLDPATGKATGAFHNPYTGKTVADPATNLPPNRVTISPELHFSVPRLAPGTRFDHVIKAPQVRGDDIWITEVTRVGVPVPGRPGGFNYSESVTLHARVSDLADPSAIRVPCATHFTNIVDWRPWMNMDGHPGHLTAIGAGRYGVALEDLPETWLAATRERWPQYLENPGSLLDPVWPPA
ncbi:DUF1838 family protein [Parapedomonas caeni]